jgi:hypothetical protein
VKSPTSSISVIVKGMVIVVVTVKEGILLLGNAKLRGIVISFPMGEGAIKFRILPVDRKDCFAFKLLAKDGKVTWCISTADTTMILRAILVMMPRVTTVTTNEVVVRVGGYDGDAGCCSGRRGCRTLAITGGTIGRGRSGCACNACPTGGSGGASPL